MDNGIAEVRERARHAGVAHLSAYRDFEPAEADFFPGSSPTRLADNGKVRSDAVIEHVVTTAFKPWFCRVSPRGGIDGMPPPAKASSTSPLSGTPAERMQRTASVRAVIMPLDWPRQDQSHHHCPR